MMASTGKAGSVILLVDDNAEALSAMEKTLAYHGYSVLTARSAEEALRISADASPAIDLAVLDWVMPAMSGTELARALRARDPSLPILLVSGFTDMEIGDAASDLPGAAFLRKPFTIRELADRVQALLTPAP